jgi:hypothetical protein
MIFLCPLLLAASCQQVAVFESGARVECVKTATVGARSVETPAGIWDASLDPVAAVADAAEELRVLAPLQELDFAAWSRRAAERGLLGALLAADPEGTGRAAWLDALAGLGRRIDPLPAKVEREERVAELWKRVEKAEGARLALLVGRLESEISDASSASPDRRVGLADLRRALRGRDADLRWAAGRLALRQHETSMLHALRDASFEDDEPCGALAAAAALHAMDGERALGWWVLGMWRERNEGARVRAVRHLATYGADEPAVVDALVLTLSAEGYRAPGAYAFFGTQITVVTDFDVEVALASAIADPNVTTLVEGAVLAVRVYGATMAGEVRGALHQLTGADPGPKASDWKRWQQQRDAAVPAQ